MKIRKFHSIALCLVHFIPIVLATETAKRLNYTDAAKKDITRRSKSIKCLHHLKDVEVATLKHNDLGQGIAERLIEDRVYDNNETVYNLECFFVVKFGQETSKGFVRDTKTTDDDFKFLATAKKFPKIIGLGIGVWEGKTGNRCAEYLWVFITGHTELDEIYRIRNDIKISANLTVLAIQACRQMTKNGEAATRKVLEFDREMVGITWISTTVTADPKYPFPEIVQLGVRKSLEAGDHYWLRGYAFWKDKSGDIYALCLGIAGRETADKYDMPLTQDPAVLVRRKRGTTVPDPAVGKTPGKPEGVVENTTTVVLSTNGDTLGDPGVTESRNEATNTETRSPKLPGTGVGTDCEPKLVSMDFSVDHPRDGREQVLPGKKEPTVPCEKQTPGGGKTSDPNSVLIDLTDEHPEDGAEQVLPGKKEPTVPCEKQTTGVGKPSDPNSVLIDLTDEYPEDGAQQGLPEKQEPSVPGEIQAVNTPPTTSGMETKTLEGEGQMSPDGNQPAGGATVNDIVSADGRHEVETDLGESSATDDISTEKETLNTKTNEEETGENLGENSTVNDNKSNFQTESSTSSTKETKAEPKIKSLRDQYLLAVSLTKGAVPLSSTSKQPTQLSRSSRNWPFRSSSGSNSQPIGKSSSSNDRLHQTCDISKILRRNNSKGAEKKQTGSGLWNGDEETVTTILKELFPNKTLYRMVPTKAARIVVDEGLKLPFPQSVCDLKSGLDNQLYVVKLFELFESSWSNLRSNTGFKEAATLTLTAWKEEVSQTEFWTHLERGVKEGNAKVQWGDRASGSVRIGIALLSRVGANQVPL